MRVILIILLSLALLISLAALAFAVQNTGAVTVSFLIWQFESSLALVLLIAFGLGALVSVLLLAPPLFMARLSAQSLRRNLAFNERLASSLPETTSESSASPTQSSTGKN